MNEILKNKTSLLGVKAGDVLPRSAWHAVTQSAINQFADATGDHQWIHVDPDKCKSHSPFGVPIAHGFMTASMIPAAFDDVLADDPAIQSVINYGIDKLRFLEAVRVNDEIAFNFTVSEIKQKSTGKLIKTQVNGIIRETGKKALAGEFLMLVISE